MIKTLFLAGLVFVGCILSASATTLEFSALMGGGRDYNEEAINGVAVDKDGFIYVVGESNSPDFPATTTFGTVGANLKCFVAKLSPDGSQVIYRTLLLGGAGRAIAVDSQGRACVIGETSQSDFPVKNAMQATITAPTIPSEISGFDAFVAKLDATGQLVFSTFYGGSDFEMALGIALDANDNIYVAGLTASSDLPVSESAAKKSFGGKRDAFLLKLSGDGNRLLSSYVGGSEVDNGMAIALGPDGSVFIAGQSNSKNFEVGSSSDHGVGGGSDAFVAKVNPATALVDYVVFLGGSGTESASAIALDATGNIFVTGQTLSTDFPTTPNSAQETALDGYRTFAAKINPANQDLAFATYMPGDPVTNPVSWPLYYYPYTKTGLVIDSQGFAMLGSTFRGITVISRLNAIGSQMTQTFPLGSWGGEQCRALALAGANGVVIGGQARFSQLTPFFPTTSGAFHREYLGSDDEAFISKFSFSDSLPPNDNFAAAIDINGSILTESAQNGHATAELGEAAHASQVASHSLWWKWTAPQDGWLTLDSAGSSFNTVLSVYLKNADGTLKSLAEADDFQREGYRNDNTSALAKVPVKADLSYYVAIDGKNGATGRALLSFIFTMDSNDDWASATQIAGYGVFTGANSESSREAFEPVLAPATRNSVWWKWTAPNAEGVSLSSQGSTTTAFLGAFSGASLLDLAPLATPQRDRLTFLAEAGKEYSIMVDSGWGETGDIRLEIKKAEPPANDSFLSAILVEGMSAAITGSNLNATTESGENTLFTLPNSAGRTVWWKWTPPVDGWVTIDSTGNPVRSLFTLFHGQSFASLPVVASCDQADCRVMARVQQGELYYLRVDSISWDPSSEFTLQLELTQPPEIIATSAHVRGDGQYEFSVKGIAGRTYLVQASPNLQDWTNLPLGPFLGELFTVTVPALQDAPMRFLRLQEQ